MSYLLSSRNPFRPLITFVVFIALMVGGLVLLAPDANATEPTYRLGNYTCQVTANPDTDPCVLDMDPASDPIAVEPDNDPIPAFTIAEDMAGWDCRKNGNGVCGPGSDYAAGCYNRTSGELLAPWSAELQQRMATQYRPCGKSTPRDAAMTEWMTTGIPGTLCAANGVCWTVDQVRPDDADGAATFRPLMST